MPTPKVIRRANWAALLASLAYLALGAGCLAGLASLCGCNVERAAHTFGEQFRQWHPIDAETARALGEGVRPNVTVIDEKSAAILAAAVEHGLAGLFAPKTPVGPPAATSDELWKGLGGLAAMYGVNQIRKWWLNRKNGVKAS